MLKMFYKIAIPAVITNFMTFGTLLINVIFAGRLDDPEALAAVGITNVLISVMIIGLSFGINSA